MPLHVEILYNEYNAVSAFAVASLLMLLAIVTLVAKAIVERKLHSPTIVADPSAVVRAGGIQ